MKNVFYFMLEPLFVFRIYTFLSWLFDTGGEWLDTKAKVDFKIYDDADWEKNNCSTDITQYLMK